jgi:hypothetical protein
MYTNWFKTGREPGWRSHKPHVPFLRKQINKSDNTGNSNNYEILTIILTVIILMIITINKAII